jgi:hypothetical protein
MLFLYIVLSCQQGKGLKRKAWFLALRAKNAHIFFKLVDSDRVYYCILNFSAKYNYKGYFILKASRIAFWILETGKRILLSKK